MQAIELVQSPDKRDPAPEETKQITRYCYEHGLITITAGTYSNVVRVLVPLVVTDEQMDEGMDVLESALQMVYEGSRKGAIAQPV
jgi:4-aminobutyrate aminotransferase/(S)-3-amino-2-methylpropionate transaminase